MIATPVSANREQLEESFELGEANVMLEGLNPLQYPLYLELKGRVLSGEMTVSEMTDAIIADATRKQQKLAAA
jgi:hypothetical protein